MSSSANLGSLKTDKWEQLQDIADRFDVAWKSVKTADDGPDLSTFLPPPDDPLRSTVLHELVKSDVEMRWRKGGACLLDHYLQKFPELGTPDSVSPQLIFEEYCSRQKYGDKPTAESYEARFPGRYQDFQRQLKDQPLPTMATPVATPSYKPAAGQPPAAAAGAAAAVEPVAGSDADFLEGYKKIRKIGSGGFGEVWQAEAPGGVPVAVKMLFRSIDDDESKRELESLEVVKTLRHPYLLATQTFRAWKSRLYIVMELADESLRDRLKECRKAGMPGIPLAELLNYFREAAEALDYLHSKKVLHRDIKPDNILSVQQHTKLADFGLARLHESEGSMMASGSGTPAYMPPEVWNGKVCPASDQYSLALTFAELRLDRRMFASKDMMQLMMDHLKGTPDLDPLPEAEQQVLRRALSKDHNERYANCKEFVQALYTALAPLIGKTAEFSLPTAGARSAEGPSLKTDAENFETRARPSSPVSAGAATQDENFATMSKGRGGMAPPPAEKKKAGGWKAKSDAQAQAPPMPAKAPASARRSPLVLVGVMLAFVLVGAGAMALLLPGPKKGENGLVEKDKDKDKDKNRVIPSDVDSLPDGCVKAEGAAVESDSKNKRYYNRIDYVLKDNSRVPFVLIPRARTSDPKTFYIMEDKVSAGLFKKFAAEKPGSISDKQERWKLGGIANQKPTMNVSDRQPAFNMLVEDAWRLAQWLGGELPTEDQWDKAAGEFEPVQTRGLGPFDLTATDSEPIAIDRGLAGPMDMAAPGKIVKDRSKLGVRYLAGNGQEFTRNLTSPWNDAFVPLRAAYKKKLEDSRSKTEVSTRLRSAAYFEPDPYQFPPPEAKAKLIPTMIDYLETKPYVGFRVVLELPD